MRLSPVALCLCLMAPVASAQDLLDLPDEIAGSEGMAQAAQAIADAGVDKLLIADLVGSTLEGPGGEALGTVENLVAVPGGRLVAALVSLEDGTRIAVPYAALKVAGAAGTARATVPMTAEELRGMTELQDLATQLGG